MSKSSLSIMRPTPSELLSFIKCKQIGASGLDENGCPVALMLNYNDINCFMNSILHIAHKDLQLSNLCFNSVADIAPVASVIMLRLHKR